MKLDDLKARLQLAERLSPARAEWFEAITASHSPSPDDYRAMLLVDDEPGVSSIIAQMMLDQDALDIAELINAAQPAATAITDLEAQVERLSGDGIHTCHDQCPRVACVLRREKADLEALVGELGEALCDAEQTITCGSKGASCYCPNCDTSFGRVRDVIRATLAKLEKARG